MSIFFPPTQTIWHVPAFSPSDSITSLMGGLDSEAAAYQRAAGISPVRARSISAFLTGLSALGIRDSFVDGMVLRTDSQPAGTTAYSLRGTSNLALTGTPQRCMQGWKFANSDPTTPASPQRLFGALAIPGGEWSILTSDARLADASITGNRRHFQGYRSTPSLSLAMAWQTAGSNGSYSYGSAAPASIATSEKSSLSTNYLPVLMRNAALAAAASFSTNVLTSATLQTVAGRGQVVLTNLTVGCGGTDGVTFSSYSDALVSYWLAWSSVLPREIEADLAALINRHLMPKWHLVLEGDSLTSRIATGIAGLPLLLLGANYRQTNRMTAGALATAMAGEIGTANGINAGFAAANERVVCSIFAGANGLNATETLAQKQTALDALWTAARGYGYKVAAWTVTPSYYRDAAGQTAVITALNDWIKTQSAKYDVLIDADAYIASAQTVSPPYRVAGVGGDTVLYSDEVHFSEADGGGAEQLAQLLFDTLDASGLLS